MKIVKFLECSVGISYCNLSCDYCYIRQTHGNKGLVIKSIQTDLDTFRKAFSPSRWGGHMFISICGFGETMVSPYLFDIVSILLELGHIVSITTNGTVTKNINRFCSLSLDMRKRLMFQMSFHYLELKKNNLLDEYVNNFKKLRSNNISAIVKINVSDSYIPYIDEIKMFCNENFGGIPAAYPCRDDTCWGKIKYLTKLSDRDYYDAGLRFESLSWPFMFKYLKRRQRHFCYGGLWSALLNLDTGELRQCYFSSKPFYNIYDNVNEPILFSPVGYNCKHPFCVNADFFLGMGVVPTIKCETFLTYRNAIKNNWVEKEISTSLTKLYDINKTLPLHFIISAKINYLIHVLKTSIYAIFKKIK